MADTATSTSPPAPHLQGEETKTAVGRPTLVEGSVRATPAATVDTVDRVVVDHRIMGGVPGVRGTRIPVATILGLLGEGLTPAEVIAHNPQLVVHDVLARLRYAADLANERFLPRHQP